MCLGGGVTQVSQPKKRAYNTHCFTLIVKCCIINLWITKSVGVSEQVLVVLPAR